MVSYSAIAVVQRSKSLYYVINFISFAVAVFFFDTIKEQVSKFVEHPLLVQWLPFLVLYVLAVYVIPQLGYMIATSFMDGR